MNTDPATHPVTLFTGQWADLPFEQVAKLAADWGYDGLEIAASGDHLDLKRADEDPNYLKSRLEILNRYGLQVHAISNHLTGQAVCDDPIDFRHQAMVRGYTWADGDAEGVRQRAAEDMKRAARVARKLDVNVVVGFTGSNFHRCPPRLSKQDMKISQPAGTRSSMFLMTKGCASHTRFILRKSRMTIGLRCAASRQSDTARHSVLIGTPHI